MEIGEKFNYEVEYLNLDNLMITLQTNKVYWLRIFVDDFLIELFDNKLWVRCQTVPYKILPRIYDNIEFSGCTKFDKENLNNKKCLETALQKAWNKMSDAVFTIMDSIRQTNNYLYDHDEYDEE